MIVDVSAISWTLFALLLTPSYWQGSWPLSMLVWGLAHHCEPDERNWPKLWNNYCEMSRTIAVLMEESVWALLLTLCVRTVQLSIPWDRNFSNFQSIVTQSFLGYFQNLNYVGRRENSQLSIETIAETLRCAVPELRSSKVKSRQLSLNSRVRRFE